MLAGRGKAQCHTQSRLIVGQIDDHMMQPGDCRHEAETEPAPGRRPARIEAIEAAEYLRAFRRRDARAAVGDDTDRMASCKLARQLDPRAGWRVAQRVFHEIDEHLGQQFSVTPNCDSMLDAADETLPLI